MNHNDTASNNPITTNNSPINPPTSIIINPYRLKDSIYSYLKLSRCEIALLIYILFQKETEVIKEHEYFNIAKDRWMIPLDKITIDVIELYRLTGMSRSSFYRTFKKLVKKGYIIESKYDIVDQSGSKENKEKYNLV